MLPQPKVTGYSPQKEAQTSLHFCPTYLPTLTWLGFPLPPPSQGIRPKRTKKPRERGKTWRAPVGGHMSLPAQGGTTLSRLRRNAGKGGRALILAHTHTTRRTRTLPAALLARTRLLPTARRRMYRPSGREQSAGRRCSAWRPTVTRPPSLATPSPSATRPSCRRMPPNSPHIFRQPLNWTPRTLANRLPLKAEGPQDRGGKPPNSMTH